jgi:vacuolar-type H+-ATPase subunit E/Vma4
MKPILTQGSSTQGLKALSRGVLGEVRAEVHENLEDANTRAESIRQEAQRQAEARRKEILQRARHDVEPVHSQAVASAQLEAQRLRLESREELLSKVFSAAQEKLKSAPQWPDYPDFLRHLIREATANLAAAEVILHADPGTQKHLSDAFLAELGEQLGVRLARGAPLDEGVGIVAETPSGHRRYRSTLEARLQRLQEALRAPVYRILKGGSS